MIPFLLGFICGAVAAVVSPPVFRFVSDKVADAKDRFK
jgi:hypothetical protein